MNASEIATVINHSISIFGLIGGLVFFEYKKAHNPNYEILGRPIKKVLAIGYVFVVFYILMIAAQFFSNRG